MRSTKRKKYVAFCVILFVAYCVTTMSGRYHFRKKKTSVEDYPPTGPSSSTRFNNIRCMEEIIFSEEEEQHIIHDVDKRKSTDTDMHNILNNYRDGNFPCSPISNTQSVSGQLPSTGLTEDSQEFLDRWFPDEQRKEVNDRNVDDDLSDE